MRRRDFDNCINTSSYKELFIGLMGWNQIYGQSTLPRMTVEEKTYIINNIAERNGFQILTCEVDEIPTYSICKKLDIKVRKIAFDYICIFVLRGTSHNLWVAPIKKNGKREIVSIEFENASQANFLFSKIDGITFEIDEVSTITDVKERVSASFGLNSEKITKNFYRGFKAVMKKFTDKITGVLDDIPVDDNRWKQWYASIMLNRLMFCYFIQKKGFLNNNKNYLRDKLNWVKEERGANRFFETFYKGFLTHLFHDGLNHPVHDADFMTVYGRIPFLNGGIFGIHLIESEFPELNIEDKAFEDLFDFLDTWNWHLDTRLESDQKDINPDVLGYIFEQYVNDKAEMGAYYTQEDITEYISKNSVLPYILSKLLSVPEYSLSSGYASSVIKGHPDRYLYDALKYGYTSDWKERIPDYISEGIYCSEDSIIISRTRWSEKVDSNFGLKKESWRDAINRFQRCDDIISKISSGEICSVQDFITYNLDIRLFARDLIVNSTSPSFIESYFKILKSTKILDLACGSGAFLFASMNVLEPLYEEILSSISCFRNTDSSLFAEDEKLVYNFQKNPQFFVYSFIALNNLYGVDIMREAVETAKLRLFLTMVSTMEVNPRAYNMGLCPLPDLDFNLFSGNSLTGTDDITKVSSYISKLEEYKSLLLSFVSLQIFDHDNMERIVETKKKIINLLNDVNSALNCQSEDSDLEMAVSNNVPMLWPVNFYHILEKGGFDVVIGNPPYRENRKLAYSVSSFETSDCGNVYTCMLERAWSITRPDSFVGMIVQLPIVCTDRMVSAQNLLMNKNTWIFNFDDRPGKLFENLEHIRVSILFTTGQTRNVYSSKYTRWYSETRNVLFDTLSCAPAFIIPNYASIPKLGSEHAASIMDNIVGRQSVSAIMGNGPYDMYYHNAPLYFTRGTNYLPFFRNERGDTISSSVKKIQFDTEESRDICCSLLNSTLFYMWYVMYSDCRHLNVREIEQFPLGLDEMSKENKDELVSLCSELMENLDLNKIRKVSNGNRNGYMEFDEYKPKPSKPIMDKIDKVLAKHFGFSQGELDYILNYDVKFRMNDDL